MFPMSSFLLNFSILSFGFLFIFSILSFVVLEVCGNLVFPRLLSVNFSALSFHDLLVAWRSTLWGAEAAGSFAKEKKNICSNGERKLGDILGSIANPFNVWVIFPILLAP